VLLVFTHRIVTFHNVYENVISFIPKPASCLCELWYCFLLTCYLGKIPVGFRSICLSLFCNIVVSVLLFLYLYILPLKFPPPRHAFPRCSSLVLFCLLIYPTLIRHILSLFFCYMLNVFNLKLICAATRIAENFRSFANPLCFCQNTSICSTSSFLFFLFLSTWN